MRLDVYIATAGDVDQVRIADARFVAVFAHSLEHAGGYTPEESTRVARTLLPDILFYDPEKLTRDNVGPHKDLLARFPYVGPPHQAPSAEVVAA